MCDESKYTSPSLYTLVPETSGTVRYDYWSTGGVQQFIYYTFCRPGFTEACTEFFVLVHHPKTHHQHSAWIFVFMLTALCTLWLFTPRLNMYPWKAHVVQDCDTHTAPLGGPFPIGSSAGSCTSPGASGDATSKDYITWVNGEQVDLKSKNLSLARPTYSCSLNVWWTSQNSDDLTDTLAMQQTCTGAFWNPHPMSVTLDWQTGPTKSLYYTVYLCCITRHSNTVSVNLSLNFVTNLLTLVTIVVAICKPRTIIVVLKLSMQSSIAGFSHWYPSTEEPEHCFSPPPHTLCGVIDQTEVQLINRGEMMWSSLELVPMSGKRFTSKRSNACRSDRRWSGIDKNATRSTTKW